jgi:anti-sigma factor RsiW
MKCKSCSTVTINKYIDGELDNTQRDFIENHLKECEICADNYRDIKASIRIVDNETAEIPEAPEYLWRKISLKLEEKHLRRPLRRLIFWPTALGVAVAGLLFFQIKANRDIESYITGQLSYFNEETTDAGVYEVSEDLYNFVMENEI